MKIFSYLLFALPFATTLAHAQLNINVEEINQRSADTINAENKHHSITGSLKKAAASFGHFVANDIIRIPVGVLKERYPTRSLTKIEENQIATLSCVDKILKKNKGGYDTFKVAGSILNQAFNEEGRFIDDEKASSELADECWKTYKALYNFSTSDMNAEKIYTAKYSMPSTTVKDYVVLQLALDLHTTRPELCEHRDAKVEAALFVGLNAGLQKVKCLYPDGRIKNYVGPEVGLSLGLGARVVIGDSLIVKASEIADASVMEIHGAGGEAIPTITVGIGSIEQDIKYHNGWSRNGTSVGFYQNIGQFDVAAGVRVFNSSRRWDIVFNNAEKYRSIKEKLLRSDAEFAARNAEAAKAKAEAVTVTPAQTVN